MTDMDLKKTKGKGAVVLKTDDYVFMQYLVDGKSWFMDIETFNSKDETSIVGNIYKGKVTNTTVNGMTFVDIGIGEDVMLNGEGLQDGEYVLIQIIADKHDGKTFKGSTKISFSSSLSFVEASARKKAVKNPYNLLKYSKELSVERKKALKPLEKDIVSLFDTEGEIRSVTIRTNAENKDNGLVFADISETLDKWKNVRKVFATKIGVGLIRKADGKYADFINGYLPHSDFLVTNDSCISEIAKKRYDIPLYFFENEDFIDFDELKNELGKISNSRVEVTEDINFKIDYTEACTFIDVNAGGFKRGRSEELTKLQVNLIASKEILRQISLRNVSGPIIIDFISLKDEEVSTLIDTLITESKNDRQKTIIYPEITKLGMVEMERKRTYRIFDSSYFDILFSKQVEV